MYKKKWVRNKSTYTIFHNTCVATFTTFPYFFIWFTILCSCISAWRIPLVFSVIWSTSFLKERRFTRVDWIFVWQSCLSIYFEAVTSLSSVIWCYSDIHEKSAVNLIEKHLYFLSHFFLCCIQDFLLVLTFVSLTRACFVVHLFQFTLIWICWAS